MNIDVLDRVENRFNKLIRKSSELVVVQFQPFKAESINSICFRFFFISRILPREVLKCWGGNLRNPIVIEPKILKMVPKLLKISLRQPDPAF